MTKQTSPYIHHSGDIIIPFSADAKYHFWNGGQQLCDTLTELNVTEDVWNRHTLRPYPESKV